LPEKAHPRLIPAGPAPTMQTPVDNSLPLATLRPSISIIQPSEGEAAGTHARGPGCRHRCGLRCRCASRFPTMKKRAESSGHHDIFLPRLVMFLSTGVPDRAYAGCSNDPATGFVDASLARMSGWQAPIATSDAAQLHCCGSFSHVWQIYLGDWRSLNERGVESREVERSVCAPLLIHQLHQSLLATLAPL